MILGIVPRQRNDVSAGGNRKKGMEDEWLKGGKRLMANLIGKRYVCKKCGAEIIITRGGSGTIMHCGEPMDLKK